MGGYHDYCSIRKGCAHSAMCNGCFQHVATLPSAIDRKTTLPHFYLEDFPGRRGGFSFGGFSGSELNLYATSLPCQPHSQIVHAPCGIEEPAIAFPLGFVADLQYPNSAESFSVMARTFSTPLTHAHSYCAMVTACTKATYIIDAALRCISATSTTVTVDSTPPALLIGVTELIADDTNITVKVEIMCSDPESGVSSAWISLGTVLDPSRYLANLQLEALRSGACPN